MAYQPYILIIYFRIISVRDMSRKERRAYGKAR